MSHSYQTYFGFPGSDLNLDCGLHDHVITRFASRGGDEDQPNTKLNHAKYPLEVPSGPITRVRAQKFKEALNGLVHNT